MIDSTFVQEIVDNAQPKVLKIEGREYSTAELHNPPLPRQPAFPAIEVFTLDSLVDYIAANRDAIPLAGAVILVSEDSASLLSAPAGESRVRDCYASAGAAVGAPVFGSYQPLEDFRIYLLTKFKDTPDRETILRFIAKVSDEHVATSEDNGVAQSVTVKSGIATHIQAVVPSPVQLAPIRTFIEVEQPVGHFLFRMKQAKDALPTAALFELHTNWKRDAAIAVKQYLDTRSAAILKDRAVPVFA